MILFTHRTRKYKIAYLHTDKSYKRRKKKTRKWGTPFHSDAILILTPSKPNEGDLGVGNRVPRKGSLRKHPLNSNLLSSEWEMKTRWPSLPCPWWGFANTTSLRWAVILPAATLGPWAANGIQNTGIQIKLPSYFCKTAGFVCLFLLHTFSLKLLKSAKNDTEPKKITKIKQKPQEEGNQESRGRGEAVNAGSHGTCVCPCLLPSLTCDFKPRCK